MTVYKYLVTIALDRAPHKDLPDDIAYAIWKETGLTTDVKDLTGKSRNVL